MTQDRMFLDYFPLPDTIIRINRERVDFPDNDPALPGRFKTTTLELKKYRYEMGNSIHHFGAYAWHEKTRTLYVWNKDTKWEVTKLRDPEAKIKSPNLDKEVVEENIYGNNGLLPYKREKNAVLVAVRQERRQFCKGEDRPVPFNHPSPRWWAGGESPKRDSKKRKCYRAEDDVRRKITQLQFLEIKDMAMYVRDVMESKWFQQRWPYFQECIVVQKGTSVCRGGPRAYYSPGDERYVSVGRIQMSTWGMGQVCKPGSIPGGEMIVLHELAHAITTGGEAHGRLWARTFVELVTHFMGKKIGDMLRESFATHRVPLIPYRWENEKTKDHRLQLSACREEVKRVKQPHGQVDRTTAGLPERLSPSEAGPDRVVQPEHV